jgi:hypothetical protein
MLRSIAKADAKQSDFGDEASVTGIPGAIGGHREGLVDWAWVGKGF